MRTQGSKPFHRHWLHAGLIEDVPHANFIGCGLILESLHAHGSHGTDDDLVAVLPGAVDEQRSSLATQRHNLSIITSTIKLNPNRGSGEVGSGGRRSLSTMLRRPLSSLNARTYQHFR